MPLRLFGGRGSDRVRTCPACEQEIAAQATFCSSCYMVFRPDGAADLRQYLQGGRVPSDVYLLRKMQVEDPNTGPVVRLPRETSPPPAPEPVATPPAPDPPVKEAADMPLFATPAAAPGAPVPAQAAVAEAAPPPQPAPRPRPQTRTGVEGLLEFAAPFPPATSNAEGIPGLFAWMLEQDPIIPNNTTRLQAIHASVFRENPPVQLGYEQHILLQIADDLALHPIQDALDIHLVHLTVAYRRAAEAYHEAAGRGQVEADRALWQMASMATRLRVEAWVYRSRHGVPPEIASQMRRLRASKPTGD